MASSENQHAALPLRIDALKKKNRNSQIPRHPKIECPKNDKGEKKEKQNGTECEPIAHPQMLLCMLPKPDMLFMPWSYTFRIQPRLSRTREREAPSSTLTQPASAGADRPSSGCREHQTAACSAPCRAGPHARDTWPPGQTSPSRGRRQRARRFVVCGS